MKKIVNCFLWIWYIVTASYFLFSDWTDPEYDYVSNITVDSSNNISQAITNAINDVKSHNFNIMSLSVKRGRTGKYFIKCGGMTLEHIIDM